MGRSSQFILPNRRIYGTWRWNIERRTWKVRFNPDLPKHLPGNMSVDHLTTFADEVSDESEFSAEPKPGRRIMIW